jgi:hypothetical protein
MRSRLAIAVSSISVIDTIRAIVTAVISSTEKYISLSLILVVIGYEIILLYKADGWHSRPAICLYIS